MKLKVIDLFSGVGGLSYGFAEDPHFELVAANEILPDMAKAYALNHPTVRVYEDDVVDFSAKRFERDIGHRAKSVSVVVGGPPCQAYSTVGKRLINDPRGKLFQEYSRVLREFKPDFFIFENVKGLLSMQGGELLATIKASFASLGYMVQHKVLNAVDYGAPQIRERVIITGSKFSKPFVYPRPTHGPGLKTPLTMADALADLPLIAPGERATAYAGKPQNAFQREMRRDSLELMDHEAPWHNQRLLRIMKRLPQGGTARDLPANLRPVSGFPNSYARLWWDRPATTVTRNLGTPSSARCIHPVAPRPLTTREGARLQTFPDDYAFFGSRTAKNLQIGNAVPVKLGQALTGAVLAHFKTNRSVSRQVRSRRAKPNHVRRSLKKHRPGAAGVSPAASA